ncbi:MAG: hypothetical protein NVS4B8_23150 [Herpetosiphon sp.]
MVDANQFDGLRSWRCIGPVRGGRVVAVAGDHEDTNVFYFGGCAGGVWKTTDGGTYWQNVSDGFFNTSAVGALAVAPSDANVIYAGTGETTIRIDVSYGDGVYKSTDAGTTWQHVGLADTRFIGKTRVHPTNADLVYVAALGHAFGPNEERGVYKSEDGGANWRRVLHTSDRAGAVDLSIDATNPRRLYAAIWEAHRSFSDIVSGGPGSGLWRSTDGGETWSDLSERPGMPVGLKGKIGVVASPAKAGRVWALIEYTTEGGLYRSDDGGDTWERVCENQHLVSRAWYYMHLTADPQDADTVYVNNLILWKSTDGGKSFTEMATPHGDNHDLWIDPRNPRRMIQGNDGGACVSYTGGATWSSIYNQPTAQLYHIATDTRSPYTVYGTQQDNSSIGVPSRSSGPAISWADCFIAGTGESGYIAVRPDDPNIVYVGAIGSSPGGGNALQRYDHRTKQIRLITTWPEVMSGYGAIDQKYRFAWTYPIVISPHDPKVLYIGGNLVFRSTNEGQSWEAISPDLTRADPATLQPTGGPVNRDAVGAEVYATVYAFAESSHEQGLLWAGSDDGLLHLSRDGGKEWNNITPPDLPEWSLISCIELSPHDKATAYVAATRYKLDDYGPYLFKTTDYGRNWQRIDDGIAQDAATRVVRTDPHRRGLLYAGTETGFYISFDDGWTWQRFQLNLPVTPIYDLLVKDNALIVATHGRSIWILDDLTPLYQQAESVGQRAVQLFKPGPALRVAPLIDWSSGFPGKNYVGNRGGAFLTHKTPENMVVRTFLDAGQNPQAGAVITYYLKEKPSDEVKITFADAAGREIRTFRSVKAVNANAPKAAKNGPEDKELKVPAQAGWNRFVWDLRYPPAVKVEGNDPASELTLEGPLAVPGNYRVTLQVGDHQLSEVFEIAADAAAPASQEDLQAQFGLLMQIHTKTSEMTTAINRMRDLRAQLEGWHKRMEGQPTGKSIAAEAKRIAEQVVEIEKRFLLPDLRPGWADNLNQGVRLLEQIAALPRVVALGNYRPTDVSYEVFSHLSAKIDDAIDTFNRLIKRELPALNHQIAAAELGAVVPLRQQQAAEPEETGSTSSSQVAGGGMEGGEGQPGPSGEGRSQA